MDFGNKTWSATFKEAALHELLAPRRGTIRQQVRVGGLPWYDGDFIVNFTVNLKFGQ